MLEAVMESLKWQDAFSVNHAQLDEQHQIIFRLANELFSSIHTGKPDEMVNHALDSLAEYTVSHFRDEEEQMEKVQYPKFTAHKIQHEALLAQLDELRRRFHGGDRLIATEMLHFVVNEWLFKHILSHDSQFAPYMGSSG